MQLDSILSTTAPPSSNSSSSGEREGIGRLEELLIGALRTLTHKQDEQVTTSRALQRSILELSDIVQGTLCEGHERQARDLHSLRTDVAGLQSKLDALGRPVTFAEGGEGGGGAGSGGGGAVANWANASRLIHRALSPSPGQGLAGLASESELSGHGGNSCHGGMLTDRSMSAEGLRLGEGSGHGGNSCHEGSGSRHGGSLMLRRFSAPATLEDDQGSFTEGSFKTRRDMNQSPSTTPNMRRPSCGGNSHVSPGNVRPAQSAPRMAPSPSEGPSNKYMREVDQEWQLLEGDGDISKILGEVRSKITDFAERTQAKRPTVADLEAEGTLFVQLLRGNGLLAADANGFSDPYVKLSLGEQKQRSKTMKKTLNPVWTNEVCLSPSHAFFTRLQPSAIYPPSTALP